MLIRSLSLQVCLAFGRAILQLLRLVDLPVPTHDTIRPALDDLVQSVLVLLLEVFALLDNHDATADDMAIDKVGISRRNAQVVDGLKRRPKHLSELLLATFRVGNGN